MADPIDQKAYIDAMSDLEPCTSGLAECEARQYLATYKEVLSAIAADPWIRAIKATHDSMWRDS
jgi:hypothetical protein